MKVLPIRITLDVLYDTYDGSTSKQTSEERIAHTVDLVCDSIDESCYEYLSVIDCCGVTVNFVDGEIVASESNPVHRNVRPPVDDDDEIIIE